MTVKELIAKLSAWDDDVEVVVKSNGPFHIAPVIELKTIKRKYKEDTKGLVIS